MKRLNYILTMTMSAALLLTGCMKEDIDELRSQQAQNAERIAALEQWQTTVNSNISSLQTLVNALGNNDYVTGVIPVMEGGVEVGYTITFVKSSPITIRHGKKGDTGATGAKGDDAVAPVIGVKEFPDASGVWYWTLDGEFITHDGTPTGNKMRVTGDKGDPGTNGKSAYELAVENGYSGTLAEWLASLNGTNGVNGKSAYQQAVDNGYSGTEAQWLESLKGIQGVPGATGPAGATPKVAIGLDNGEYYWFISPDGTAPLPVSEANGWDNTGTKATGEKGETGATGPKGDQGDAIFAANGIDDTHDDYVKFTLAGGDEIKLPKYKGIGISFTQPNVFTTTKSVQTITLINTGSVAPSNIRVVDVPSGWIITVNGSSSIRITAPVTFTAENFRGEATVLVGNGDQVAAMYPLSLRGTGGFYKVGDYYPDPYVEYDPDNAGTVLSGTAAVGVVFWLTGQADGDHPYDAAGQNGLIVGLYERAADHLNETWATNYGTTYGAGTGWYMPVINHTQEFDYLYCAYNGMAYQKWGAGKPTDLSKNYPERDWFRSRLTNAGGDSLTDSWYWTTTRDALNNAYCLHFNSGNKELSGNTLSSNKMRAVKAF